MRPHEASARSSELQLVDVREPGEWARGHVDGSTHIPMGEVHDRVSELDSERPVLAICRSGQRSGRVAAWLLEQGFEAHNLDGGLVAWQSAGLPLLDSQGRPGDVA